MACPTRGSRPSCSPSSIGSPRNGGGRTAIGSTPSGAGSPTTGTPTVCTISPKTALPALNADDVVVDGYTQPGTAPNARPLAQGDDARIAVRLDGSKAPEGTSGIVVAGDRDTVRGLSVTGFIVCFDCGPIPGLETGGTGVEVHGTDDVVAGNFLGLLPDGATAAPNQFAGVNVTGSGAGAAHIGGTDPASTNV